MTVTTEDGVREVKDEGYKKWISELADFITSLGHEVIIPHENCDWRDHPERAPIDLKFCHASVTSADAIVAYVGNPQSGGVCLEVGFAATHGKKCVILKKPEERISLLLENLHGITDAALVEFNNDEELFNKLEQVL